MTLIAKSLVLVIAIITANIAFAKIYKWTDENGQVHFGNVPPKHQKAKEINVKSGKPDTTNAERLKTAEEKRKLHEQQREQKRAIAAETSKKPEKENTATADNSAKKTSSSGCKSFKERMADYERTGKMVWAADCMKK